MQHFLLDLTHAAARPSVLLLALVMAGLVLLLARRAAGRPVLILAIGGQVLLLVLPTGAWIGRPLEDWYPQPRPEPVHVDGVIVLGGATRLGVSAARGTPGLNQEAECMTAFLALARRHPEARLVFTGGSERRGWTEADAARLLFRDFGLEDRVQYEDRSQTTWENAIFSRDLVHPAAGGTWLLVTSALHMPRAVAAFRAAGWPVVPYPVAYRTGGPAVLTAPDPGERVSLLDTAVHEWIGIAAYWLRGRAELAPPRPG